MYYTFTSYVIPFYLSFYLARCPQYTHLYIHHIHLLGIDIFITLIFSFSIHTHTCIQYYIHSSHAYLCVVYTMVTVPTATFIATN